MDEQIIPLHKFEFLDLGDLFIEASRIPEKENLEFAIGNGVLQVIKLYTF